MKTLDFPEAFRAKALAHYDISNDGIVLSFFDGSRLLIHDASDVGDANRYPNTDDALQDLMGHKLQSLELGDEYQFAGHDCVDVKISTSGASVMLRFHNEHDGSEAGFDVRAEVAP